jgi:FAD:protein FMN transferase
MNRTGTPRAAPGRTFPALGTTASVLTREGAALDPAEELLRRQLEELDQTCSRFKANSELSLALGQGPGPVAVSDLLVELVQAALEVARLTGGAVDPTVGSAMERLGYDRDFAELDRSGPPPDGPAVPAPGWEVIDLDPSARTLRVPPGVKVDLGSSAKAYAADRAAASIAAHLGTGVLVNLGGDIAVAGPTPEAGWPVGLALCSSAWPERAGAVVAIRGGGLASSGTAVRAWQRGGRRVHHIVDPRTGDTADGPWSLVSVTAPTCLVANAGSTAALVLGEGALDLLEDLALPARLVRGDGTVITTGGWPPDRALEEGL